MESNFEKRVNCLFLISHRNAISERGRYYRLFEAYAHMYNSAAEALDIKALPFEWDDYPIIFYQTRNANGDLASIAFRGAELREGIANSYERVPSQYAHTIATSLLADAPSDITLADMVGRVAFEKGDAILADFNDARAKRRTRVP